jgi:ActR/RegA family two-component response regulator
MAEAAKTMDVTVSIVEDNEALRDTLVRYVHTRGFRCVSAHGSAEEALRELPRVNPMWFSWTSTCRARMGSNAWPS